MQSGTRAHYNYFRDYDPGLGRYVESDPSGLEAGTNTYGYALASPGVHFDSTGLDAEVGVRQFYPVPVRHARHCFVRFNGNNNDTMSFTNQGVGPDANPSGRNPIFNPGESQFSGTKGKRNDACVRREMNTCQAKNYDFEEFNCCDCVARALNACGLRKEGDWPNWPKQASDSNPRQPPKK